MIDDADAEKIARAVISLLKQDGAGVASAAPLVTDLEGAMRRTGFNSPSAFYRWSARFGLRSMLGAQGRYEIAAIDRAIARSTLTRPVRGLRRAPVPAG